MASFSLSPAVVVREFDLTGIIPAVATTQAAISGVFRWGPLDKRVLVDYEPILVERFGKPTNLNAETFFTAASFLSYSNQLYVSRAGNTTGPSPIVTATVVSGNSTVLANTSALSAGMIVISSSNSAVKLKSTIAAITNSTAFTLNSSSAVTANSAETLQFISNTSVYSAIANVGTVANLAFSTVKNEDDFHVKEGDFDTDLMFIARYPGEIGNSLRVSVCDTAAGFNSVVNLASFANGGATVTMNVGSNSATVVVRNGHDGSSNTTAQTAAVSAATSFKNTFQVTDLVQFGNNDAGFQSLKITAFGNTTSTVNGTVATATFSINFEDDLRLIENQSVTTTLERFWEFYDFVDKVPGQSSYVLNQGNSAANDELHVIVVYEDGLFSGLPGTVLESYKNVSRATDAKTNDGAGNWYRTVINTGSKYIWIVADRSTALSNTAANIQSASNTQIMELNFNYGADGSDEANISLASLVKGYDLFASAEDVDISLIMQGKARGGTAGGLLANYITDNITEIRKDCVGFFSPEKADVVNNYGNERDSIIEFRNTLRSSSYSFLDSGYKYMYDRYNDVYHWIPLNGDSAGLCARTDLTNDAWWSPAGFNRGKIKNTVKLAYTPRKADRDELYKNGINPVVAFPGSGFVLFGDKTLLDKASAFDRINVRRLFITIEKAIATASKYFLFEFNDDFTRAQFRNMIIPYLRDVQGRRGITDFKVVCDRTNNTPEIIDSNQLVGNIFIKPARSINTISLNFVAVRTGVSFSEVAGLQF